MPPPQKVEVSPVVLIQAMEEKFEVTTFSMNLLSDEVTSGICDGNWWQDFAYRDCLKMQVPGKVNAGFGREILDQKRITATPDTLTIDLGTPTIHDVVLDPSRVKVLNPDDEEGYLTDPDKNLQAKGFVAAIAKLKVAACNANILQAAALSAEKHYGDLVRTVLKTAGDRRNVKFVYTVPKC
jgi:hypothetical protein